MRWAFRTLRVVEATEPLLTFAGVAPPEGPDEGDWETIHVDLNLLGSREVDEAFDRLRETTRQFFVDASALKIAREQADGGVSDLLARLTASRAAVHASYDEIRQMIRDDLANL
jgi:hypothetical protein